MELVQEIHQLLMDRKDILFYLLEKLFLVFQGKTLATAPASPSNLMATPLTTLLNSRLLRA